MTKRFFLSVIYVTKWNNLKGVPKIVKPRNQVDRQKIYNI